ncbi:MAG: flagellar basal-body rod protein FlgF [Pirellulales bacterium]
MAYGMYVSAEGAQAQAKRLEVLSNNLANVDTPGFKRDLTVFQARYAAATARGHDYHGSGSINDLGGGVQVAGTVTEFGTGPLKQTGVPTDMAIEGEGFFVIRRENQDYLTRAGDFRLDTNGKLVSQHGDEVLSSEGEPITIDPELPWYVTSTGQIVQAGSATELAVVRPQSLGDLVKVGERMFSALADTSIVEEGERRVQSGFLELSGVNPTTSMVELIETSRAFEANVNMIKFQDQALGNLIGRLLGGNR